MIEARIRIQHIIIVDELHKLSRKHLKGIEGVQLGFWKNEEFLRYLKNTLDIR